jgi:hypothetical protein
MVSPEEALAEMPLIHAQALKLYDHANLLLYQVNEGMQFASWEVAESSLERFKLLNSAEGRTFSLRKTYCAEFEICETMLQPVSHTLYDSFRISRKHHLAPSCAQTEAYSQPLAHDISGYREVGSIEVLERQDMTRQRQYSGLLGRFAELEGATHSAALPAAHFSFLGKLASHLPHPRHHVAN